MAILLDLSQTIHANANMQISLTGGENFDKQDFKKRMLYSLSKVSNEFSKKFGHLIICQEGNRDLYWRKQYFEFYKAGREKKKKEILDNKTVIDWVQIYEDIDQIVNEIMSETKFAFIQLDNAEADDIIAVLAKSIKNINLILSADKDFIQLQNLKNIYQYSPMQKIWINHSKPNSYRKEHIIQGDRGDSIPNFLSPDDSFANNNRQKSIYKKDIEKWLYQKPEEFCTTDEARHGWERNRTLIDFSFIPEEIQMNILVQYAKQLRFKNIKP